MLIEHHIHMSFSFFLCLFLKILLSLDVSTCSFGWTVNDNLKGPVAATSLNMRFQLTKFEALFVIPTLSAVSQIQFFWLQQNEIFEKNTY